MSTWPSSVSAVGPAAGAVACAAGSVFCWQAVIASATTKGKNKRRYGAVNRDDMWTPSVRTVVSGGQCCASSPGIICPQRASSQGGRETGFAAAQESARAVVRSKAELEADLDLVADPGRVGPFALADTEVEPPDGGTARERRVLAIGGRGERERQQHIPSYVADGQTAPCFELARALGGKRRCLEPCSRPAVRGEEVAARKRRVAIAVLRIGRARVDLDQESTAGQVGRVEPDLRGKALETALEFRAGLHCAEHQLTVRRVRTPGSGRQGVARGQNQQPDAAG